MIMKMVEIAIKIPEETKERLALGITYMQDIQSVCQAISEGTVLPKGHGDLIDRDRLINRCLFMSNDDTAIEGVEYVTKGMIKTATTVVKADKEVSE